MKSKVVMTVMFSILVVGLVAGCTGTGQVTTGGTGRAAFGMKDAAANLNSVNSIHMTVDSVKVHSDARGWITASSAARTYDLMQLRADGSTALVADTNLPAGSYDKVQFDISSIIVGDANGQHPAVMPSREFAVVADFVVNANSTSAATFDFIADESLHVTSNGEYVLAPVAQVETRSRTQVAIQSNDRLQISGGDVDTRTKVGMDINGNVGVGLYIPANLNLSIGLLGGITSSGTLNLSTGLTIG